MIFFKDFFFIGVVYTFKMIGKVYLERMCNWMGKRFDEKRIWNRVSVKLIDIIFTV